jgi:hypothetical protein
VDADGDVGRSCALAVGTDGSVHIAYHDGTHAKVKYAKRDRGATAWSIRTLASQGNLYDSVDLALDPEDHVHIVFYDRLQGTLFYATTRSRVGVQQTSWSHLRGRYR